MLTPEPPRRSIGLSARHVRRVTPEHVGQRVSLRRWVTDPLRGPVQADVVGRLLAWADDDRLVVVDRAGRGWRVDAGDVLSSRVVPEHPRLAAEPFEAGTADLPLEEVVVRALLLADDRVLLAATDVTPRWHAPGILLGRRQEPAEAVAAVAGELLGHTQVRVTAPVLRRASLREEASLWWRTEERWHVGHVEHAEQVASDRELAWHAVGQLAAGEVVTDPDGLGPRLQAWHEQGPPDTAERLEP